MFYIMFQDENVFFKLLLLHIHIPSKQDCEFYLESPFSICQRTTRIFILLKAIKKNNKFNPPLTSQ